jgi:hypothetical protein
MKITKNATQIMKITKNATKIFKDLLVYRYDCNIWHDFYRQTNNWSVGIMKTYIFDDFLMHQNLMEILVVGILVGLQIWIICFIMQSFFIKI